VLEVAGALSTDPAGIMDERSFLGVSLDCPFDHICGAGCLLEPLRASFLGTLSGICLRIFSRSFSWLPIRPHLWGGLSSWVGTFFVAPADRVPFLLAAGDTLPGGGIPPESSVKWSFKLGRDGAVGGVHTASRSGATITDAGILNINELQPSLASTLAGTVAIGDGYTDAGSGATITDAGVLSVGGASTLVGT